LARPDALLDFSKLIAPDDDKTHYDGIREKVIMAAQASDGSGCRG
jgi:hypothetical protein